MSTTTDHPPPITCTNCEACCCELEVFILSDTGVPPHLLDESPWGQTVMRRLDDGRCVALDRNTMRCTIYASRPQVCRDFAEGSPECIEQRQGCLNP